MKQVICLVSQKGGVGKSTTARAILDILRGSGRKVAAYDADGSVGQLLAFYGQRDADGAVIAEQDPCVGVGYFDVRDEDARDTLLAVVDNADADVVLIDLPGGTIGDLEQVVPGGLPGLMDMYRSYGFEPTIVHVITPLRICAATAMETIERCAGHANVIIAKNLAAGAEDAFFMFDGDGGVHSQGRAAALLAEYGGREMRVPAMRGRTYGYVDANQLPFSEAASREVHRKYRGDRLWVRAWLQEFKDELERVGLLTSREGAAA